VDGYDRVVYTVV